MVSARNASTSARVGGRPSRSSDSRRISVTLSASGDGAIPSFSSRARMKWSMPLRAQVGVLGRGQRRPLDRLERPVAAGDRPAARGFFDRRAFRPLVDPALEQCNFVRRQLALGRHLGHFVLAAGDRVDQQAVAGCFVDRRSGVAAALDAGVQVEPQVGLLLASDRDRMCSGRRRSV